MVDLDDHSCDRSCVICGSTPGRKRVSKTRRSSSIASCGQRLNDSCVSERTSRHGQRAHRRTPTNHSVLPTEFVASIPDAPMLSVTLEAHEVERDNVVTKNRDVAMFTPTPGLPRVTTPARKTGRSRVAPARQADYVMD